MEKTIEIPKGYEARIEGNKIILEPKESEDERIRKALIRGIKSVCKEEEVFTEGFTRKQIVSWLEKQGEQNPAWSEGDEKIYQSIIDDTVQENQLNKKQTDWLRDIKYRYFPQPKQEWSEEDEDVVDNIIKAIQHLLKENDSWGFLEDCFEWLKSLKERYTWKPSDEHYELEEFAKIVRGNLTGISKDVEELFESKYFQITGNKMFEGYKD